MLVFLLFGAIFANYLDQDCSEACVKHVDDDVKKDCLECGQVGCTPDGKTCRPFTCNLKDLLGDWTDQAYDVTCNWNKLAYWAPLMQMDTQCGDTSPIDCTKSQWSGTKGDQGGIWKGIKLYRQKANNCAIERCPDRNGIYDAEVPHGTVCTLKCRMDGADGGTRTCTQPSMKTMQTCREGCTIGNLGCPDFSCSEVQGSWTGNFKGGKWDVCYEPFTKCGNHGMTSGGTKCCSSEILGIGQGGTGTKGKEAGCEDKCTCERTCSKYGTVNKKRQCITWSRTGTRCCGAMELSLMFITIVMLFML